MDLSKHEMYSFTEMDVLFAAIHEGDIPKIKRLLRPELDIDTRAGHRDLPTERVGHTMLEEAAAHKQLDTMKFLIQQGANIDLYEKDPMGEQNTILLSASFLGNPDVVRLAIESGADINRRRFRGSSAFHEAVERVSWENRESKMAVVDVLLEYGLDIDNTDEDGRTALHWAASSEDLHMANFLISRGANVNAHVKNSCTPLDRAAERGDLKMVKLLLDQGAEVNVDSAGCLGLGEAALSGETSMVSFLLDHGAERNAVPNMHPELFEAACSGNAETVALLYERGFARQGPWSLFTAIVLQPLSVVKLLLAQGIDINFARSRDGRTFLHAAVLRQSQRTRLRAKNCTFDIGPPWDEVKFLLDKGADASIRDSNGQTAQEFAVASGHMDAVEIFESRSRCLQSSAQ